jgi:hypothetical protein
LAVNQIDQRQMVGPETFVTEPFGVTYDPPRLVKLGSVHELTEMHCIDEHGSPLPHAFCVSP